MSIDRLILNEIAVDRFGGLTDRRVLLPDDRFVVLHGRNESGKSTLAQLLAWLLVGPYGTAADAQRFGEPDEKIGGSLAGRLGSDPFLAKGAFKVLQRGAPADTGLSVDLHGPLDASQWRSRLCGVDFAVLEGIYRLWGEQLHDGAAVESRLLDAARGVHASAANVGDVLAKLERIASQAAGRNGSHPDSLTSVRKRIHERTRALQDAEGNADQHADVQYRIGDLETERDRLTSERDAAHERVRVMNTVIGATERISAIATLEAKLESTIDVPAEWMTLAEDPEAVRSCISALREAEADLAEIERKADQSATELGAARSQLEHVTITEADLAQATRITTQLGDADAKEAAAVVTEAELRTAAGHADRLLEEARAELNDHATVSPSLRDASVQAEISTAIGQWSNATNVAEDRRADLVKASDESDGADAHAADLQNAWDARGTGCTAAAWMQERATTPATPSPAMDASWWLVPVIVAIVAVAAAALGQWPLAAVAGAAALLALALRRRSTTGATAAGDPIAAQAAMEAAQAVLTAEAAALSARENRRKAQLAVDGATHDERRRCAALTKLILPHGFEDPVDPASCQRELRLRIHAAVQQHDATVAATALTTAEEAIQSARKAVATLESELSEVVSRCGIRQTLPAREVEQQLRAYRDAADRARRAAAAVTTLAGHRSSLDDLVAPVQKEVEYWRLERIVEQAEQYAETLHDRRTLERTIDEETRLLAVQLGDDDSTRELHAQHLAPGSLEALLAEATADAAAAERRLGDVQGQLGALRKDLDALEKVEQTAALRTEIGALEELLQERAGESAAASIAARLLADASDRYVRTNQPGIVKRASELACATNDLWSDVVSVPDGAGGSRLVVRQDAARDVPASKLSTAARGLLYLAFRIALAEHDATQRGIRLPLLCDDPLVHFDDQRAEKVLTLLRSAGAAGHQVLLFTCHQRTVDAARLAGAAIVEISTASDPQPPPA